MTSTRPLALITGASSGIGLQFAQKLAAGGCDLILVARRREPLEETARAIQSAHRVHAEILPADLSLDDGVRAVEQRIAAAPPLAYLINNAGFGTLGLFLTTPVEDHERMHRVHILATLRLTRAALPAMVERGSGALINVSSVSAFGPNPGSVGYSATKAWMNTFTEGLAMELKSAGSKVRVQALCPGFTITGFHDAMHFDRGGIPSWMWMSADRVVDTSLRALEHDRLFVIPGLRNRLLVLLMRGLPRPLYHSFAISYARKTGRDR
jgi:short-subunit dehydrogenase